MTQAENIEKHLEEIKRILMRLVPCDSLVATRIDNLFLCRREEPGHATTCLDQPKVALNVQGVKVITSGSRDFVFTPGEVLVTCVDLPSTSIIEKASPSEPFLTMFFYLDKKILSDLLAKMSSLGWSPAPDSMPGDAESANAYIMEPKDGIIDCFLRLAKILAASGPVEIIAKIILYELHYFLLASPQGMFLRTLYMSGGKDNRIIEAINWLKNNLDKPVSIRDLAQKVNMSVSSLHRHFKNVTGYSPLQYHKNLRLYEAQRIMFSENERADNAAMSVGYESVTQFNREYKRMFGEPPHRDITRRKNRIS